MWLPSASHHRALASRHRADRGVRHELRAFPGAPGQVCHPRGPRHGRAVRGAVPVTRPCARPS